MWGGWLSYHEQANDAEMYVFDDNKKMIHVALGDRR